MAANEVVDRTAQARRVAEEWYAGWSEQDADRMAAVFTEDARWEDSLMERPLEGRDEIRRYVQATLVAIPDVQVREVALLRPLEEQSATFASRWQLSGTFRGALSVPGTTLTLQPTGDHVDFEGIAMVTLRDGLISHLHQFGDSITLQRQIGSLPEPGSRGERFMARLQAMGARRRRKRNGV